jgi:hypothetical protein
VSAAIGDLIQLVDVQDYLGQQVLNVYYYRTEVLTGLGGDYLSQMNDWWMSTVLPPILAIQSGNLGHVSREWRNMSNGTDLFIDSSIEFADLSGSGENLPSYVSWGYQLQRESLVTRNGYKRFAGVVEGWVIGNDPNPSNLADLQAVEPVLAANIVIGIVDIASPIIVKRPITAPVASYDYSNIGSATFRGLGTQNTRKAGRGT